MRLRSPFPALVFALAVTACGKTTAAADTDMVMCLAPRCDNPDPNSCACPDDTDGIVSNTPTDPTQDPETSTSHGDPTTDLDSSTTTSSTTDPTTTSTETTSSESTSTESTSTESSSSDTSTGTDTSTGSESSESGSSSSGTE